jgi:D-alanine-D-alanine ligase
MSSPRILILFNEPILPAGHAEAESEHEILFVTEVIRKTLNEAGYDVSRLAVSRDAHALLGELQARPPHAVFNLFEGLANDGNTEACVASLLEWQGIPFTGSPSQALRLARHKALTKYVLQGAGLPTPKFQVVDRLPLAKRPRRWPVIVKPALEDASVGIDQHSVVGSWDLLTQRAAYLLRNFGPPVLVERFIPGREFNISVIETPAGLRVLPLCEIKFAPSDPSHWPIVTYDAKWHPESRDFKATPTHFPVDLDPALGGELERLAMAAFQLVGCRDYARVDFRVSPKARPYIIEVNPNPCISPMAGFAAALEAGGKHHAQFIVELTRAALARGRMPPCPRRLADGMALPC